MKGFTMRRLLALALLATVLLGERPTVLASDTPPAPVTTRAWLATNGVPMPVAATPAAGTAETPLPPAASAPAYSALAPCSLDAHRAACADDAAELAAYGLDVEDLSAWTAFGLRRFVQAVERLADAFGGGELRSQRVARFTQVLGTDGGRLLVVWQAEPQARDGNPVRGGYAANRLYFNPNTYYLDTDTAEEARERSPEATWWPYIHELAHLWDERSAPVAQARHSAAMRRWVDAQLAAAVMDEYPSSYAVFGGPAEAFAESVAATVTGDAAGRDYYGSPRDTFVRTALCEAVGCR